MNPHDPYAWNAVINGKQITLLFHTYNVMITHGMANVVSDQIKLLDGFHGKNYPLTVTRGKIHECLGMTIDFRNKWIIAFLQHDAIKKFWRSLPPELKGPCRSTPAPVNLFKVDSESPRVDSNLQEKHHAATAKSLWFSQRSRTDPQISTGFHCTRVREMSDQDVAKFRHLSGRLWLTRCLPLMISMHEDGEVCAHVDSAHAAHAGGRGHSGLCLTIGSRGMINASKSWD